MRFEPGRDGCKIIAGEKQDLGRREGTPKAEQDVERGRLVEGFAARDGETVRRACPTIELPFDVGNRGLPKRRIPGVDRDATRAAERAALEPDTDSPSGPSVVTGKWIRESAIAVMTHSPG